MATCHAGCVPPCWRYSNHSREHPGRGRGPSARHPSTREPNHADDVVVSIASPIVVPLAGRRAGDRAIGAVAGPVGPRGAVLGVPRGRPGERGVGPRSLHRAPCRRATALRDPGLDPGPGHGGDEPVCEGPDRSGQWRRPDGAEHGRSVGAARRPHRPARDLAREHGRRGLVALHRGRELELRAGARVVRDPRARVRDLGHRRDGSLPWRLTGFLAAFEYAEPLRGPASRP